MRSATGSTRQGLGQSIWVGVGGDLVKGVRFADMLRVFFDDSRTKGIILVGEVGGAEEEECAEAYGRLGRKEAVVRAHRRAAGEGRCLDGSCRSAGARQFGTLATKTKRLTEAGRTVFGTIGALVDHCARRFRFDRR